MTVEDGVLLLDEASARQLVLARAVEDADPQGKVLSAVEREQIEGEALEASRAVGPHGIDFTQYLLQRARRMLAVVDKRQPRIASLQDPLGWQRWLLLGLPLLACGLGAAIDRIDNPHQVNMLSPALLGVLAWNLAVYVLMLLSLFLPRAPHLPAAGLLRWLSGLPAPGRRTGRLHADVLARFHEHWLRATGRQQWLWFKQLLHLSAVGWALGLALSIVLGGIVRQYRVGWESTLLGVEQVHAFLRLLFAPVVALLPFESFSVADLQRMAFGSGAAIGVEEARRWVWMYLALLFLVVVLPRAVLAAWSGWRRHRLARAVCIDLRDPYFVQVLARVSPARITVGLLAPDGPGRDAVLRMLHQVADRAPPLGHVPWTVLSTAKGDVLRVFEVPPGTRPPSAVVTAQAAGGSAAQAWLQDLLGRFKAAPRAQGQRDAVQATLADTDLMLVVPHRAADLRDAGRLLHWVGQPTLVLAPDDEAVHDAAQQLGIGALVLPLERCTSHWLGDPLLLEAAAARVASSKRAGFERLAATWQDRNAVRFGEAMRLLATELARAARDSEDVGSAPVSLRHLLDAAERDASQRAREGARQALLQRLRESESALLAELVQLYRSGAPVAPIAGARLDSGFSEQQPVDTPQAGIAGAATGAAMGAGIDLLTGGLTLGAAAALGAMIGGGAAYAAAAWRNRGSPGGQPQVQLGDELLQTFTEGLVLTYLVVAHRALADDEAPAGWRSEVVAAVEARADVLSDLWQQARQSPHPTATVPALATILEDLARELLERV
ncbi:hypothetical protein GCM10028796_08040 [Ramlibacter monticola]|uniref:DUF3482 domain-containing protein n=1 Tax=Ramlibacter monticola TaxID=1926872 RepID=A0A936YSB8_9BURK|nr:DUF3482 domain-containing protein [Ramlibacter monticola]MBL0389664.1 DUF3482 domain-containing protein [Ramlibacter monticola]